MSLDLGELVGFLQIDDTRWNRGIDNALRSVDQFGEKAKPRATAAGQKAGDAFGNALVPEAEKAGEDAGEKAGEGLVTRGRLAAAAAGTAFGAAFNTALDIDAGLDKLNAQLESNTRQARRYGRVAGDLYAGAWGDSMEHVDSAIASVVTSIEGMNHAGANRLTTLTARALDFASAFEIDVVRATQVAGVVIDAKLAKNGVRAFDLLTKGAQKVPVALREDLLDAVEEYSQFFKTLGYSGPQAFSLLVDASAKGMYGLDKAGDAIKEFTIRSTDGSKATGLALESIGLDADVMTDKILAGGDSAQKATQKIIDGLLAIEDPGRRATTALTLFGTPLEDLNVKDIPAFLRSLKGTSDSMDDVAGAGKRMGDTLNDNTSAKMTAFKRKLQTEFVGYFVSDVIPVLEDDVIPAIERFGDWFEKDGGPALRDFADDLKPVLEGVKDLAGFLNDMPGGAKLTALGAALGGGLALKMKGSDLFGGRGSIKNPAFVTVTNPGFGAGGSPGKGGILTTAGKGIGTTALGALGALGLGLGIAGGSAGALSLHGLHESEKLPKDVANNRVAVGSGFGGVWGQMPALDTLVPTTTEADIVALTSKVGVLGDELDLIGNKKVNPSLTVPNLPRAHRDLQAFLKTEIDAGRNITPYVQLNGFDRAMQQINTLTTAVHSVPSAGVDNGVTFVSGGTPDGRAGVNFNGPITVKANSPYELSQQLDKKTRHRSRGGR